jgi:ATP-binding cassette subfamily B protein
MNLAAARKLRVNTMQARSVIPGRQRWDIGVMLARPPVAQFLEDRLRQARGVEAVRANPTTGRLLVLYETVLTSREVEQLIRKAVELAEQRAEELPRPSGSTPTAPRARGHRYGGAPSLVLAGGAALVLIPPLSKLIWRSPLARIGSILVGTVVIIRRAWRRSIRAQQDSTIPSIVTRRPLLTILGPDKSKFYLASFLSVLSQILDIAISVFIACIIAVSLVGKSAILARLGLASAAGQIWFLVGTGAATAIVDAVVTFRAAVLWRNIGQSVQHHWRTKTYAHVQRARLRYLEGERATRLARVLTDDIEKLGQFFSNSAHNLVKLGTSLVLVVPTFLYFSPSIAWTAIVSVPVITWLSFYYQERIMPLYAASGEDGSRLSSQLVNNLEAGTTIKSFCSEEYEIDRINRLGNNYRRSSGRIDTRTSAYSQIVQACVTGSFLVFIGSAGLQVIAGDMPFVVFNILIGMPMQILWKLPAFGDSVDQYQQAAAALKRVLNLSELMVESRETGRRLDTSGIQGEVVFDGVTFGYPGRAPVLENMSLRLASGKTTGIVGVTGAGKTTIAKLLMRFEEVDSGRVLLDGQDIRDVRIYDLRKAIGFLGQDAFLFDGTVADNIRYGSFGVDDDAVVNAARLAEVDSFVQVLPSGYGTMVGERGTALSGGQKQRIALARAIVKNAPILVLDEATSSLDNETEAAIQRALKDFVKDRTLVVIAHRLSTIRYADWIYVIGQGGVILEGGTHLDLLERGGMYASLWRLQTGETNS